MSSMSAYAAMYHQWCVPDELVQAVDAKLLSQEEARLIYWSQHPILKLSEEQRTAFTPPAIGGGVN